MKTVLVAGCLLALSLQGADFYVSQTGSGSGDGSSAGNSQSLAWINTLSTWGLGPGTVIMPGDTVHLVGVFTNTLLLQGNGTSGAPITVLFESGAKFSAPLLPPGGAISLNSRRWITIDGGSNGLIENTDNGTELGHKAASTGVFGTGLSHVTIRNLTVNHLYQRTKTVTTLKLTNGGSNYVSAPTVTITGGAMGVGTGAAATAAISSAGAVTNLLLTSGGSGYNVPTVAISGGGGSGATATATTDGTRQGYPINVSGSDITIQNNTLNDGDAMISVSYSTGVQSNLVIVSNIIGRVNHGINIGCATTNCIFTNVTIANNHIDNLDAWDGNFGLHLDGMIIFNEDPTRQSSINGLYIYRNVVGPNVGTITTAGIFLDVYQAAAIVNLRAYDNLFLSGPGYSWSNGFISGGGTASVIANNTFMCLNGTPKGMGVQSRDDVLVYNNIFYSCGVGVSLGSISFTDTVTPVGTAGTTTYSYSVVGHLPSGPMGWLTVPPGKTTTGNATLSSGNFNTITWTAPPNNPGIATFDVYRVVGGATQGLIVSGITNLTYNDQGAVGDGSAPPQFVCDYNVYYNLSSNPFQGPNNSTKSISSWKLLGFDAHSGLPAQPLLDSAYVPLATDTVARGNGINLSTYFTTDANGLARPSSGAWDIGAYQFAGRPAPPTNLRIVP